MNHWILTESIGWIEEWMQWMSLSIEEWHGWIL